MKKNIKSYSADPLPPTTHIPHLSYPLIPLNPQPTLTLYRPTSHIPNPQTLLPPYPHPKPRAPLLPQPPLPTLPTTLPYHIYLPISPTPHLPYSYFPRLPPPTPYIPYHP